MYSNRGFLGGSQRGVRWTVLCLLIIGGLISISFALNDKSSPVVSQGVSKAHVSVEDPRPLAKAIEVLEGRYGWAITYEDPRYVHTSEISDVTERVRKNPDEFKPGEGPRILIPKGGALAFDYDVSSDTNLPSYRETVVQELLDAYAGSGNAGTFRLESGGRIMHIIPTAIKNTNGELMPQNSILETRISLTAEPRTGLQKLESICSAITLATDIPVKVGMVPTNLLLQHVDSQGAEHQRARDVLTDLLESAAGGANLSWQLFYGPDVKYYALNIHQVLTQRNS